MEEDPTTRMWRERFEQAFHGNAAAMVIARQSDLRIIDVNQRWLELFAATREEVIGRTSVELGLITPEDAETRIAQHRRFTEGYDVELALRTRAGRSITVLASAKPIVISEGPCTLTTLIDITERKQAEAAFTLAFSASPAGMMLVDAASDRVVSVNRRMLDLTQSESTDLVGRLVPELDFIRRPARDELLAKVTREGKLESVEVLVAGKRGTLVWTLLSTELVTVHGVPHRLSVFIDVDDRKRNERRLAIKHVVGRVLAETLSLADSLPQVVEAICKGEGLRDGAVWLFDPAGATCSRWGEPTIDESHPAFAQAVETRVAQFAGPVAMFPVVSGDVVLGVVGLASEREIEAEAGMVTLFDSVGRLLGMFVQRARAEQAVRELNFDLERRVAERTAALQTTNRDLEAFTSTVSHDLRAPLRAIHGFSEILLEDFASQLPAEAQELLTSIHASGGRLRALIDDLLAFSRLGRSELRTIELDLEPMVRSVVDELVPDALADKVVVTYQPLGSCQGDPSLLRAVWTNLIDNALKYARTRERIEISIGAEERDGELYYFIEDNGVGFDPRYADRLFGMFQRLHSAREFEGNGVGLANVRRIVERHHGRVSATSQLDRGSRFEFTLGGRKG